MGGHIRMDKDLEDDPRVRRLTDLYLDEWVQGGLPASSRQSFWGAARNAVTGSLYSLWRYADTYLRTGDVLDMSVTVLAGITGISVTLITQFPPEWLIVRPDGKVELPGFSAKNSLVTKDIRKENNRLRQKRFRQKKRNARNALPSRKSNGRNSPSRGRVRARAPAHPGPVPPNRDRSEETGSRTSVVAELTSGQGRIARRVEAGDRKPPAKSTRELESDAHQLAKAGLDSHGIVKAMRAQSVTLDQVNAWLSNMPPKAHAS